MTIVLMGCAAPAPLEIWQMRVEEYVQAEGRGDPQVLRSAAQARSRFVARPARITFGVADVPQGTWPVSSRCDVQGVLLGYREIGGRDWYVYLVGVVRVEPPGVVGTPLVDLIEDVRLVALHASEGEWRWVVGPTETEVVEKYRRGRRRWAEQESVREAFPGALDRFELRPVGGVLVVEESGSGAAWRLPLSAKAKAGLALTAETGR